MDGARSVKGVLYKRKGWAAWCSKLLDSAISTSLMIIHSWDTDAQAWIVEAAQKLEAQR